MVAKVKPVRGKKVPYDAGDEVPSNYQDELAVAANTAEALEALGAPIEVSDPRDALTLQELIKNRKPITTLAAATGAAAFLRSYGSNLGLDAATTRAAITNKLLELANCGDPKYELKALELLGKHSDIGLFTERSEITINYRDPESLENAIKERVKRLLNADFIDVTPAQKTIEQELYPDDTGVAEYDPIAPLLNTRSYKDPPEGEEE